MKEKINDILATINYLIPLRNSRRWYNIDLWQSIKNSMHFSWGKYENFYHSYYQIFISFFDVELHQTFNKPFLTSIFSYILLELRQNTVITRIILIDSSFVWLKLQVISPIVCLTKTNKTSMRHEVHKICWLTYVSFFLTCQR